jgi:thiamine biosynthesis lipoprotein
MIQEFEYTNTAMGTECSVAIICGSKDRADTLYARAKDTIDTAEKRFSRFLPDSELSRLNEKKSMIVSDDFFAVTTKAQQLYRETKGVFNPLVQIARLGYTKTFTDIEENTSTVDEPYNTDFAAILINPHTNHIELQSGQKLDYGGILKGYLAERIAKKLKAEPDVTGVIVNLGGDIHCQGLDAQGNPFVFQIYNPITKDNKTTVSLLNQSLATSGTYKRSWKHSNKTVHHILDHSGTTNPNTTIVSASIIHHDGATSEAYAKVFLILSPTEAVALLEEKNIPFICITTSGAVLKNTL